MTSQPNADEILEAVTVLDEPVADRPALNNGALYANRELSWLDFNDRVFAEALDPRNPLLERVRFLAITASNLDEFYSKRVGWLNRMAQRDPLARTVDDRSIAGQLAETLERCGRARLAMEQCWSETLAPELAERGIGFVSFDALDSEAQAKLTEYFMSAIFPVLTPLVVDPAHPFPFISGGSLSLALNVRDPRSGRDRFARVKIPQNRPRIIDAGNYRFVLLEDLIAAHLHLLFPGIEVTESLAIRVLRSIDVDSSGEEADDLLELIESELRRRRFASAVSLEMTATLPASRLRLLLDELELEEEDVVRMNGPLGLADLMHLANLPLPDLQYAPFTPAVPSAFHIEEDGDFFAAIREGDILVHHPYESFDATVARFISDAATDPDVLAIKQTLYRTSPDSPILQSLVDASARGKQVAVLVELSARFDEANNIEWARRLEEAGVHVAYGNPRLKIHSKICLVVREEAGAVRMYGHIGTGNYNSRSAKVYTDLGLFTVDRVLCSDLLQVFNYLTGMSNYLETAQLLVAPASLRSELERRVRREMEIARSGRPAHIFFKMNALEDHDFTALLYEASQAGVRVDLVIRGICRLRTGIPGVSDNIRVVSVIGRFLEHSRVYYFANDGAPEYFIGSADLMKRNLDERIEVVTPVTEPALTFRLDELRDLLLNDRRQGWELVGDTWQRDAHNEGEGVHLTLLARAPFI